MKTVLSTVVNLSTHGHGASFDTVEGSDIAFQRNMIVQRFLADPALTHLFFVDSDMAFQPDLCAKLISLDKPVAGAIYATRSFDYRLVENALKRGVPPRNAQSFGFDWLAHFPKDLRQIKVKNWMAQVEAIGFGAVLLQRGVFETMIGRGVARRFRHPTGGDYFDFFYARPADVAACEHYTEDYSFCRRWRLDCDGEVWARTDAIIYHIGDYGYGGSFHDHLRAVEAADKATGGPVPDEERETEGQRQDHAPPCPSPTRGEGTL
jgi:hypothetical protein